MVAVAALFGMKYYQRPDVTVQLWPPSHQHGLAHLTPSWKAVGGRPGRAGHSGTPHSIFKRRRANMASMLAAMARISHQHRRLQTAATVRSAQGLIG